MRLEGQSKLGYYPTPPRSLTLIPTWLRVSPDAGLRRYLDPCCGQGEALAAIATAHGPAETFGIELSDVRAAEAERTLNHVLNAAYEYAVLVHESFSLVLLNPPYDGENATGSGRRMEETFLLETTPRITPGGILIYIIPHHRINDKIARHLAGWYSNLCCFKLAGEDYAAFDQIVAFGVRRTAYTPVNGDDLRMAQAWADAHSVIGYEAREIEEAQSDGTIKPKKVRAAVYGDLPELIEGHGEYAIPISPLKSKQGVFRFQYQPVSDDDYLREAEYAALSLESSRAWRDLIPPVAPPTIRPVMSPKQGHIAMQVNGGLLGTNLVLGPDQAPLLIKGNIRKGEGVQRNDPLAEDAVKAAAGDDRDRLQKVVVNQHFETVLTTLDAQGNFVTATEPQQIKDLLDRYVEQLAKLVEARNVPQYDLRPEPWEWAVFEPLSKNRHLPGRVETGLTTFQKHLSIALGRLLLQTGAGGVNSEMGSGKSTIALAVAEYLRVAQERRGRTPVAFPGLIAGPGIVTGAENWPKEIVDVIPGAASRVITIGAKPAPKAMKIGDWVCSLFVSNPRPQTEDERRMCRLEIKAIEIGVIDEQFEGLDPEAFVKRLQQMVKSIADSSLRRRVSNRLQTALAPLLATLKQADKRPPRRRPNRKSPNLMDARLGGYLWLGLDVPRDPENAREIAGKYSVLDFITEYRQGALPTKSLAIMSFETAKLGSGRVPAMTTRLLRVKYLDDRNRIRVRHDRVCACPTCGAIVASDEYDENDGHALEPLYPSQAEEWVGLRRRFCQAPHPRRVWDAEKGKHVDRYSDDDGQPCVCGAPLFEESDLRRMAAATMVKRAKGFFGLLVIDEMHKAKAKGTGVGWALTVLSGSCRYTLGATGTLFGGYSTSIFWLMYRLSAEVRRQFGYSDDRRWVDKYGLIKTTFYVPDAQLVAEDGAYTGTRDYLSVSERPGISPAIARWSLRYFTFSSLKDDRELPLPEYQEQIVRLALTDAMQAQMQEADGQAELAGLFKWALARNREKDGRGAISVWLNTALNRMDAMFRGELVTFHPRVSGRGRFAVRREESVLTLPPICATSVVADETTGRPVVIDNATGRVIDAEPEWLPKEQWAAHQCLLERDEDRKTLIFVRQTGTRDIQPRLTLALQLIFRSVGQGLSEGLSAERHGRAFTSMLAEIER